MPTQETKKIDTGNENESDIETIAKTEKIGKGKKHNMKRSNDKNSKHK